MKPKKNIDIVPIEAQDSIEIQSVQVNFDLSRVSTTPVFEPQDIQIFSRALDKESLETFYRATKKFVSFVETIQLECDTFDKTIPSHQERITYINKRKVSIFSAFNNHFDYIYNFSKDLESEDYKTLQGYYQRNLLPLFTLSPLNKMIYEKPLGYAGDFIMMKHYYNDDYVGNTTFDMLCHRYTLELPASRANINRKQVFEREIRNILEQKPSARICNFGSGPAIEFIELLKENVSLSESEFTFVDIEDLAFEFLKVNIDTYGSDLGKINFLHLDLLKLISGKVKPKEIQNLDFIYASGIFDYFNDKIAKRILNLMYSLLNPGGKLVIVNVAKGHNSIGYMEFLGDWKLHLRNETATTFSRGYSRV